MTVSQNKFTLMLGPCVIESKEFILDLAGEIQQIMAPYEDKVNWIFKASYDKANRTSIDSFRGPGMEKGLEILQCVKDNYNVPVITDVHNELQAKEVGKVVDVIQIPAFLCRQTDLLVAAAKTGKKVSVKKGQFLSASDMVHVVNKLKDSGMDASDIFLTERGTTFGYQNLVVDMRALKIMRDLGVNVVFDATHSVQQPGGLNGKSGGNRAYVPLLTRAAVAVGIDGVFAEVHPNPDKGLSDGPNMLPLNELASYVEQIVQLRQCVEGLPKTSFD